MNLRVMAAMITQCFMLPEQNFQNYPQSYLFFFARVKKLDYEDIYTYTRVYHVAKEKIRLNNIYMGLVQQK